MEKVVVQYTIGAREKMREKARRHARRNAYRREGLIKEQLTALNEIRSGLLNDLVLCSVGVEAGVPPYSYLKYKSSAHTLIKCDDDFIATWL